MIQLQLKYKKTKGSKWDYILFLDSSGYELHRIVMSYDENAEEGFNGRWFYKDPYFENNRVWITKYDEKEERKVSYPIKHTNKYYIQK